MSHLNTTLNHNSDPEPQTIPAQYHNPEHTTKHHKRSIFNRIFLSLVLLSACAVATVVVVWVKGWQEQVGDKEPNAGKLSQAVVEADDQCEQLEYRYKHFRSLKRRHIATIYFLNGDRQGKYQYQVCRYKSRNWCQF